MNKKEVSVGIIGTGFGKMIGLNLKAVEPKCKIYFFGRNKAKLESAIKEVGADGTFADWKKMVSDPKIDLVVIASPSSLHKEMFDYASKFKKMIMVEKPAALSSKEVGLMDKLSKSNKISIVNHEGRFNPVVTYTKNLIDSKKLGDILTVRVSAYLNWYSNPEYKDNWNNDSKLGGGQIFSVGTHQIDLARYLLEMPKIISGSCITSIFDDPRFQKKPTAEDRFSASYKTKDGTLIELFNDCYCHGYKDFLIEVVGSKGIVLYSDQRGLKVSFGNNQPLEEIKISDSMSKIPYGNSILSRSMKYLAKALIDYLKTGEKDPRFCSLKEEKENLELFEKYRI